VKLHQDSATDWLDQNWLAVLYDWFLKQLLPRLMLASIAGIMMQSDAEKHQTIIIFTNVSFNYLDHDAK